MKNKLFLITACLIAVITFAATSTLLVGCKTTNSEGQSEFDPVKTEQVKAAVTPVVASVVRRIVNDPEHPDRSEAARLYLTAVGGVFCQASATGQLTPDQIITALDTVTAGLQEQVDPLVIDAKNVLIAIYRINYAEKHNAELPPDKWPHAVLDVLCDSITQGLADATRALNAKRASR
jgi:hypothetical protein